MSNKLEEIKQIDALSDYPDIKVVLVKQDNEEFIYLGLPTYAMTHYGGLTEFGYLVCNEDSDGVIFLNNSSIELIGDF